MIRLVIDFDEVMPKTCSQCFLERQDVYWSTYCEVSKKDTTHTSYEKRLDGCPLQEVKENG